MLVNVKRYDQTTCIVLIENVRGSMRLGGERSTEIYYILKYIPELVTSPIAIRFFCIS